MISWRSNLKFKKLRLPPGPPRHFLIGNLLDLPRSKEWQTFNRWANKLGDLVYLDILGTSMLFINSSELAKEIFEKRGNIYSNRFHSVVLNDLIKLDWTMIMMQYGQTWKQTRTYFHQYFNQTAVENYREVQIKYTKTLLKRLYLSPKDYRMHLRYVLGAMILEVTYGIQISSEKDPYIILSETTNVEISKAGVPGTYLVDLFPILKHIPSWLPGAKFKRELNKLSKRAREMVDGPIRLLRDSLRNGKAIPCITTSLMEHFEDNPESPTDYEDIIKNVAGVAYFAGIDTTDGYISQFFFCMLLHPHVQKRAQAELDEIVGSDVLPSFDDFEKLKYIRGILYELLRWNTVLPAGVPHMLIADDIVDGYFIPKGTLVFGNSWTILRDKSVYGDDANDFKPERFLEGQAPPPDFAFGYGRRACPGRHFSETSSFIVIACILHLYHILPVVGENGPELPKEDDLDSGVILRPKPFKCRIIPRSPASIKLLKELS